MLRKTTIIEIIARMDEIHRASSKLWKPDISPETKKLGLSVSKMACSQPEEVAMSPLFKNMLKAAGDIKDEGRLMADSPITKAEKWLDSVERAALEKFNGPGSKGYDMSLPLDSKQFYDVDCWDNLKENQRMIVPGLEKQRAENASIFADEPKQAGIRHLLMRDREFQKAVEIVMDMLPKVNASKQFREVNLPFMTKHSNVGYPYFRNDRRTVPGRDITYAELTMQESMNTPLEKLPDYNVCAYYGRNQGKGRLIIGTSRIINLSLNRLESVEIENYKNKCSLFAGYNDDKYLKKTLTQILDDCNRFGLKCANWDQSKYDLHVSPDLIELLGAISMLKTNGLKSEQIAKMRAVLMTKSYSLNGMTQEEESIYGRIFSGFIDTNRGGGIINAIVTIYCLLKQDKFYSSICYELAWFMLVMGDDNLFVYRELDHDKYVEHMKTIGFEVHPKKQQYGVFFLQNRLFKDSNGNLIMSYPWTRVVRSMLFKETSKGLGRYGWLASYLQQLSKLMENKEAFSIVLNLLAPYDDTHLGYDITVEQLLDGIKQEDSEAKQKDSDSESTAFKLYDGDPTKSRQFTTSPSGKVDLDKNFYQEVLTAVKECWDPDFLGSLGFKRL